MLVPANMLNQTRSSPNPLSTANRSARNVWVLTSSSPLAHVSMLQERPAAGSPSGFAEGWQSRWGSAALRSTTGGWGGSELLSEGAFGNNFLRALLCNRWKGIAHRCTPPTKHLLSSSGVPKSRTGLIAEVVAGLGALTKEVVSPLPPNLPDSSEKLIRVLSPTWLQFSDLKSLIRLIAARIYWPVAAV